MDNDTHVTVKLRENEGVTVNYLSLQDVADRIGVARNTVAKYKLPEPDVIVGSDLNARRGWSVATIDAWNARRPGRGARTDLKVARRGKADGDAAKVREPAHGGSG